jgi:putative flippase GtrA
LNTLTAPSVPSRPVELIALVAANLLATVVRFVLLRGWVFHPQRAR